MGAELVDNAAQGAGSGFATARGRPTEQASSSNSLLYQPVLRQSKSPMRTRTAITPNRRQENVAATNENDTSRVDDSKPVAERLLAQKDKYKSQAELRKAQ